MITCAELHFGYIKGHPIVNKFNANFPAGTMSAIVGRSGSGKSTLLYLIGTLLRPNSGSLRIADREVGGLADWARADLRARSMGFVFQDALLDPARTILDNVLEGALYSSEPAWSKTQQRALDLLRSLDVQAEPSRRPGEISGGQAQRVALARAFVSEPAIVLADEPTGNLDSETADLVWAVLAERALRGAVVIIATHDLNRASTCDQIFWV